MQQIGFKNFRKFKELPLLDLSPITILVGENNAGKSTVVKALLSVMEFLKTRIVSADDSWLNLNFYFNKSFYTHIGTFERAVYNQASGGEPITFSLALEDRLYEIDVMEPVEASDVYGRISNIRITLLLFNITISFSLRSDREIVVVFHSKPYTDCNLNPKDFGYSSRVVKNYFKGLTHDIEIDLGPIRNFIVGNKYVADALMKSFAWYLDKILSQYNYLNQPEYKERIVADAPISLTQEQIRFFEERKSIFKKDYFRQPKQAEISVEYIYAHAVTQTVLFSAKDTNDYHVKTVHEFASQQINADTPPHDFIIEWMKKFKIGDMFNIDSVGGEAHIVKIQNSDGNWVNLADKGMGSIQLMILLFRVATMMKEHDIRKKSDIEDITYSGRKETETKIKQSYLIIIEEPEQNLHPMLQSELADFFYSLHRDYGFRIIVETHSEYLVRKTQVIVANEHFNTDDEVRKKSPFKVIYFPGDDRLPYDMHYRSDGKFSNEFGTGFFDEASKLIFDIL